MATSVSSNLDVNSMITALMTPYENRIKTIDKKISSYQTDISSWSKLKSAFTNVKNSTHKIEVQLTPLTTSEIKTTLQQFITDYNSAVSSAEKSNDHNMRMFASKFRKELDSTTLSKLGLSFDKNGVLSLNTSTFDSLSTNDAAGFTNAVNSLFDNADKASGTLDNLAGPNGKIDYRTKLIQEKISKLNKEKDKMTDQLATYEANYRRQFNNLQTILGQLDGSQNVITNWSAQMNKSNG